MRRGSAGLAGSGADATLLAIVVLGAALRVWGLTRQGVWYDESVTAWLMRGTPGQMLATLPHSESTPPLYYLLAWGWTHVFGDSAAGLRSLSCLAGIAAVPVSYLAARAMTSTRAARWTALIVAVNPLLVWYSQEARAYSLLVLGAGLSLWATAAVRAIPGPRRLALWVLAATVVVATHYFGLFLVIGEAALVLSSGGVAQRWRAGAVAVVAACSAGLLSLAATQRTRHYYFLDIPLSHRVQGVAHDFLVGFSPPATRLPAAAALGAAGVALGALVWRRRSQPGTTAPALALAGALGIPLALALAGLDYVNSRNVIAAVVPLAILLGAGLGTLPRRLGLGAGVVLAAVSVWTTASLAGDPGAQRPPWQRVATALGSLPRTAAIVLDGSSTWAGPLNFYLPHLWFADRGGARVREIAVLHRLRSHAGCGRPTWWGPECSEHARPLPAAPAPGFRFVARREVGDFEIATYVAGRPVRVYPRMPFDRPAGRTAGRRHLMIATVSRPLPG
ncbi:MAG: mannosyltransferase [Solirubrobacteraceae bacterium]|nr:mannosyltransferase [Solirubrobacteraceae bacterium]